MVSVKQRKAEEKIRRIEYQLRDQVNDIHISWPERDTESLLEDFVLQINKHRDANECTGTRVIIQSIDPVIQVLREVRLRYASEACQAKTAEEERGREVLGTWALFAHSWITLRFSTSGHDTAGQRKLDTRRKGEGLVESIDKFWGDDQNTTQDREYGMTPLLDIASSPLETSPITVTEKPCRLDQIPPSTVLPDADEYLGWLTPGLGLEQWSHEYDQQRSRTQDGAW